MTVAAFVISVLAFLTSVVAVGYTRRQALAADRSADADERAVALAEAEAAKYVPPWTLSHSSGDAYLLTNGGDEIAYELDVTFGKMPLGRWDRAEGQAVGPGSALKLLAFRSQGTVDDMVTVTWARLPGGERLEWRHPLPPKRPDGGRPSASRFGGK